MIDELSDKWSKPGIRLEAGHCGIPIAVLESASAKAEVALHGAHVLSYQPHDEKPVLWLSDKAVYQEGKAIRGGIPVCWPWFANHATDSTLPAHGFARTSRWNVTDTQSEIGACSVRLSLVDSPATQDLWPHQFKLDYHVSLTDSLAVKLTVTNTGSKPFSFTGALHSYFAVSNIRDVSVDGLDGTEYLDSIDGSSLKKQQGAVHFRSEVDRIYIDSDAACEVVDPTWKRKIRIEKCGSRSTVVWNPWIDKSKRMADFGDDEFNEMLCVETANAGPDVVTVAPGSSHIVSLNLSCTGI